MPREFLPLARRREQRGESKQAPEPMNRMTRRDMVHDRHVTKRQLRDLINQEPMLEGAPGGGWRTVCD